VAEDASVQTKKKNEVWEWIKALAIAGILAFIIRSFLFAPFLVDGLSMMPTLENRERLIVNKFVYFLHTPQPGEIIVFHADAERDYIKRVIAVEGQTVSMRNDVLYIDGKAVDEPYLNEYKEDARRKGMLLTEDFGPVEVPKGHIFVMGDNRQNSTDSRIIGPVEIDRVVGRADLVMWPLNQIRLLP
jgi:signal peptidase I